MFTAYDLAPKLPAIDVLRDRSRALAMLSSICETNREWGPDPDRMHSFDRHWRPGAELARMDKGDGDEYTLIFDKHGALLFGLDHLSQMSSLAFPQRMWPGVIDDLPAEFRGYVDEPTFQSYGVLIASACLWRRHTDDRWQVGKIDFPDVDPGASPDGCNWMFDLLIDSAEECQDWAKDYYDLENITVESVRAILELRPLTQELVTAINPDGDISILAAEIAMIGYPV